MAKKARTQAQRTSSESCSQKETAYRPDKLAKRLSTLSSSFSSQVNLSDLSIERLAVAYNLAAWAVRYARIPSSTPGQDTLPFSFIKFPFMLELYADMHPRIVIQKGLQVGASEYAVLKALHACDQLGCDVMYGFPHAHQIGRFSKTRIARIITRSDYLSKITADSAQEVKQKQAIFLRLIRRHYFHLVGVQSDASIQSESVDLVIRDEFDLMDQDNAHVLLQRNSASTKRLYLDLGFPLIEGSGINQEFIDSDQREYEVKCLKCETWQEIQWPRNIDRNRLERVCWKCGSSLEQPLRNPRFGRWTPKNPLMSERRHGYHISKLLYPDLDFVDFLKAADNLVKAMEFSVYYLGLPHSSASMRISEGTFMSCVDTRARIEDARLAGRKIYGGCDVGSLLHVWLEVVDETKSGKRSRLIDLRTFAGENKFDQLEEFIAFAQPVTFCVDIMPETTEVMRLVRKFPFMVWGVRFEDFTSSPQDESRIDYDTFVIGANRTHLLDCNIDDFLKKRLTIPGEALDRHRDLVEHFKAPVQIMDTIGRRGVPIKRWVTPKSRPDHWVFARAACIAAMKLEGWVTRDGGQKDTVKRNEDTGMSWGQLYRKTKKRR